MSYFYCPWRGGDMRLLLLVLVAMILGCSNPKIKDVESLPEKVIHSVEMTRTIHCDKSFNLSERSALFGAKNEWLIATGGIINFNLIFDYSPERDITGMIIMIRLLSDDPLVKKFDDEINSTFLSGIMINKDAEMFIVVADRFSTGIQLKTRMMKDLGHDIGLPSYSGNFSGIMNEDTEDVRCLTQYDMMLFCKKFICDWREMKYCKAEKQVPTIKL